MRLRGQGGGGGICRRRHRGSAATDAASTYGIILAYSNGTCRPACHTTSAAVVDGACLCGPNSTSSSGGAPGAAAVAATWRTPSAVASGLREHRVAAPTACRAGSAAANLQACRQSLRHAAAVLQVQRFLGTRGPIAGRQLCASASHCDADARAVSAAALSKQNTVPDARQMYACGCPGGHPSARRCRIPEGDYGRGGSIIRSQHTAAIGPGLGLRSMASDSGAATLRCGGDAQQRGRYHTRRSGGNFWNGNALGAGLAEWTAAIAAEAQFAQPYGIGAATADAADGPRREALGPKFAAGLEVA